MNTLHPTSRTQLNLRFSAGSPNSAAEAIIGRGWEQACFHGLRLRFMKIRPSVAMWRLAAATLLLLGTGCETVQQYSLTYRLWDNGDLSKWSEPAPNPNLALFDATNHADVLVQYDALSEGHSTVNRRAYYLRQSQGRIAEGKRPKLVSPPPADGMKPIAVLPAQVAVTNPPPGRAAYAVITKEGREFTLYRAWESEATYEFPVYPETSGTPMKIVLTPLAVVGDTLMVGGVAAVVGFILWVQGGAPTH
jgi:hypothetical protein